MLKVNYRELDNKYSFKMDIFIGADFVEDVDITVELNHDENTDIIDCENFMLKAQVNYKGEILESIVEIGKLIYQDYNIIHLLRGDVKVLEDIFWNMRGEFFATDI